MVEKCKTCAARDRRNMANMETYDVCLLYQYPCDMITKCDYIVSKDIAQCAADVQSVDKDSLHIVYVGRKAYHAEKTIMSSIEAMYTIRDAIAHIEHAYDKHKETLSQISCCTKDGDVTPEIDYYINKIKEAANQID